MVVYFFLCVLAVVSRSSFYWFFGFGFFRVVLFYWFFGFGFFHHQSLIHCERLVHFPAEPFLRGFLTQWTGGVFIGQHGGDD
jgi:hypothetical protein